MSSPLEHKVACRSLLLWALLSLTLLACAQAAPTPQPVTIRFAHLDADQDYYRRLAATFGESHPWITVELLPRRS